ncbi:MAG: hypothetical protein L0H38_01635 [bacterium]|nr:hypothetical protein [bacterium]
MKSSLKQLSKTKKISLIVVSAVVFIAAGVTVYLILSASQYAEHNDKLYGAVSQDIRAEVSADELSMQTLADITREATDASSSMCKSSFVIDWTISQDDMTRCQASQQKLTDVSERSGAVEQYLASDKSVADILTSASEQLDKLDTDDYASQQAVWNQVSQSLDDLQAVGSYADNLAAHKTAVEQIIKSYDKVISADKAQKRDKFDDAVADLQSAYDSLNETKNDSKSTYKDQATALVDAIRAL